MATTLPRVTWEPTDEVPATGMAAYAEPDASLSPLTTLSAGLRLHRIEDRGAWAKVAADNGWSAWVDGRQLVPLDQTPAGPPVDQTVFQPSTAVADVPAPAAGPPLGAPAGPLGGGVPSAFAPPASASTAPASSTALDPLGIAAAILGVLLIVTYLLPWATSDGISDHAFELAGDGRRAFGDFGTRTDVGIVLLQVLYGAIVLGPVAALLFIVRQPTAKVVGILAGLGGLGVVGGRLLLDVPTEPGFGVGFWLSLLASLALIVLSLAAGSRSGAGAPRPERSGAW